MIYIYDILVNFNNDFYEFYEWEKNDSVYHIKKMPIFLVDTNFMETLLTKKIIIDDPIIYEMYNKTEYFDMKKVKSLKYACLFTDQYKVVAVEFNQEGKSLFKSYLLLDEEEEILELSNEIALKNIPYKVMKKNTKELYLTREEEFRRNYLLKEIKYAYKKGSYEKINYLYEEIFPKDDKSIEE